jgi:hypothetical protein
MSSNSLKSTLPVLGFVLLSGAAVLMASPVVRLDLAPKAAADSPVIVRPQDAPKAAADSPVIVRPQDAPKVA